MILKEKLIKTLNELLNRPGDSVAKTEVEQALGPFLKKSHQNKISSLEQKQDIFSVPPQNAIGQLDEILKKYKEKKS